MPSPVLLAAIFSVAASCLAGYIQLRDQRYWWRWSRSSFRRASLCLVPVYVLVGLGGWYIDRKYLKIEESHWLVNGLVSLAIGQLIFRFDISTFEGEGHAPARSLLVELEHYLLRGVEAVAADGVLTAVRDLSLPELEQLAFDIFQTELLTDESLPGATKVQISKELDDAAQALADPPSRTQGRSRLIGFCVGAIRQRRLTFEFSKDLRVASSPRDGAGANSH